MSTPLGKTTIEDNVNNDNSQILLSSTSAHLAGLSTPSTAVMNHPITSPAQPTPMINVPSIPSLPGLVQPVISVPLQPETVAVDTEDTSNSLSSLVNSNNNPNPAESSTTTSVAIPTATNALLQVVDGEINSSNVNAVESELKDGENPEMRNTMGDQQTAITNMIVPHQEQRQFIPMSAYKKVPQSWDKNTEGWKCASWILHHAKNIGWGETLVYGKSTKYFGDHNDEWFSEGGIFSGYKKLSWKAMKIRYNEFENMVKTTFMSQSHSPDPTGAMGEEVREEIRICLEFLHYDVTWREENSQLGRRKRKKAIIHTMMEKRAPVGTLGNARPLWEVRAENDRFVTTDSNASTNIETITQMDICNNMNQHRIESVAERRAKMNQLHTGGVGTMNVRSWIHEFMNQMNANVNTLVMNTAAAPTTPNDSSTNTDNLMTQYIQACDMLKKAEEEGNEDDKLFFKQVKKSIHKRMTKDMD